MTATHEVLLLCDRYLDTFWHVTPEVRDCIGQWPDGSPAWMDHPEHADGRRIVIGVIPKRQPIDDDWVEDDPRVLRLIEFALALNDIHRLACGRVPLDAKHIPANTTEKAEAILARIRTSLQGDDVGQVLQLAMQIERARTDAAT